MDAVAVPWLCLKKKVTTRRLVHCHGFEQKLPDDGSKVHNDDFASSDRQIHTKKDKNWNGHMMKRGATAAAAIIMVDDFDCKIILLRIIIPR